MRILTCLFLMCATPVTAYEVVAVGIYCPEPPDGERVEAPGTELGWVRKGGRGDMFDVPGRFVPAEHNLSFGVIFRTPADVPRETAQLVMTHPPLGPDAVTIQTHDIVLEPGTLQGVNWVFEFDYERVEGHWTRALVLDGEPLWEVAFEVGPAGSNPMVNKTCFANIPIS